MEFQPKAQLQMEFTQFLQQERADFARTVGTTISNVYDRPLFASTATPRTPAPAPERKPQTQAPAAPPRKTAARKTAPGAPRSVTFYAQK
jgi:hypothetical protein